MSPAITLLPPTARDGVRRPVPDVPPEVVDLASFREWVLADDFPDRAKGTYIRGRVSFDVSNELFDLHAAVRDAIFAVLYTLCQGHRLGRMSSDGVLLSHDEADVSNNPDAMFIGRDAILSGRVRFEGRTHKLGIREVVGTPDMVLEVVSDSSVTKDKVDLRAAYYRAGIPEYWLVDARSADDISFDILRAEAAEYESAPVEDGWRESRAFGRWFRLERFTDEFGVFDYRLHVRGA